MTKIACVFALILFSMSFVSAQSALDGFDPNANGTVRAVAVQPDGKILIGGNFTTVLGQPRNRIARLNADGTLDTAFDPNSNSPVLAITVQTGGKILVGGLFNGVNSIGGQSRNYIARLEATTGLADSFDPNANNVVYSIVEQSNGNILVGGAFNGVNSIGGQARNYLARLDAATGAADSWNPNANNEVRTIAVQSDEKILAGGAFNSIGGATRNRIARLSAVSGSADSLDPNANGLVYAIAVQSDGKILVGGDFSSTNSIGGQTRNRIARLDATTGLADSFDPNANNIVVSISIQSDGKILVGGLFIGANSIGGQTRNRIARLDATTGLADSFDPNANSTVFSIGVQRDGKILVGGAFNGASSMGGQTRNYIARLERDGRLDRTLDLNAAASFVHAIAIQPDGKILIGGLFTTVLGVARNNIARLNVDGTLDTAFNPDADNRILTIAVQSDGKILAGGGFSTIGGQTRNNIARLDATTGLADSFDPNSNGNVYSIAVQSDGRVLAGGIFTTIGGQTRNSIARLDATTGLADSFNPNAGGDVESIAVQADGRVLAGGSFVTIGGQTRNRIARLDAATGLADSWNPNASFVVTSIAVQSDGKILAGGLFATIGGQARNRIARLDATTGLADSWNPNANNNVDSIAVQADGKILAGGAFSTIGGQTRNRIARLDATTGLADSWNPNANSSVSSISVQSDGKILVGGYFFNIGGQFRNYFARLSNDTAALSTLTVTKTNLTLTRDGSAPQFSRVIFEQSIDNGATYTLLGTATNSFVPLAPKTRGDDQFAPLAAGYTLGGLFLPTTQNVLIRARGFYRSGHRNGSETTEDKVQIAYLLGPSAANVSVSGRVLTANGSSVRNAIVQLTDLQGNTRTVRTGSFGYYRFDDVEAGQTYVVGVASKRYVFTPRTISVADELTDVDFLADESLLSPSQPIK